MEHIIVMSFDSVARVIDNKLFSGLGTDTTWPRKAEAYFTKLAKEQAPELSDDDIEDGIENGFLDIGGSPRVHLVIFWPNKE